MFDVQLSELRIPNPPIRNPNSKIEYPLHFHYFLGVFPPNGKGYDQCQFSHLFDYFGFLHVFLKTTGNPKGTIRNDPEFKRETHQTLDTGDLPH